MCTRNDTFDKQRSLGGHSSLPGPSRSAMDHSACVVEKKDDARSAQINKWTKSHHEVLPQTTIGGTLLKGEM